MDSSLGIQIAHWTGLIIGLLSSGLVYGILPFIIGIILMQRKLSRIALIITLVVRLIFGHLPAILSALIFTAVIIFKFKKQEPPLVEVETDIDRNEDYQEQVSDVSNS